MDFLITEGRHSSLISAVWNIACHTRKGDPYLNTLLKVSANIKIHNVNLLVSQGLTHWNAHSGQKQLDWQKHC